MRYVIVGAGVACAACAAKLLELTGPEARVVVLEAAGSPQPSPALMPEYAAGQVGREALAGSVACDAMLSALSGPMAARLELRTSCRVAAVEPDQGAAVLTTGDKVEFDRLLVATGSGGPPGTADGGPLRSLSGPGVFRLRSWRQAERLRRAVAALPPGGEVAVIGGGPTGLRVAACLLKRGLGVTLVEALPYLLGELGSEQAGAALATAAREAGMRVILGAPARRVERGVTGRLQGVTCAATSRLSGCREETLVRCSLAIVCAGAGGGKVHRGLRSRPAGQAGNGFLAVDDGMRTAHENVWAAGDAALPLGWNRPPGLWRVAAWQGRQAALTLAGREPGPPLDRVDLTLRFLDVLVWAWRPYALAACAGAADQSWRVQTGPPGTVSEPPRNVRLEVAAGAS